MKDALRPLLVLAGMLLCAFFIAAVAMMVEPHVADYIDAYIVNIKAEIPR